jgi:DNA-binding CsgD family transcriptional regulator
VLSHREVEVLQLMCEGKSVRETAEILGLSPKTVDSHRANIMGKLDMRDVPSLVKFAIRMGVTEP